MAGGIHGIISRDEAWSRWQPYGERVELDGSLDPNTLTASDALQVILGADENTQYDASGHWDNVEGDQTWYDGLSRLDLHDKTELVELLVASQAEQQRYVEGKRNAAFEGGLAYVELLGSATRKLQKEGLISSEQLTRIETWLIAPDGQPYIQYTPMTQLEYARLALKYDGEEIGTNGTDCTDFNFGIIRSAVRLSGRSGNAAKIRAHNKVHESVHGSLSGVEIYDITREDGWRRPEATVVGVFAYEPSTAIVAGDDFAAVENVEVCEGWTDFIARQLIGVEPELGVVLKKARGYAAWAKVVGELQVKTPDVYEAVTEATLAESDSSNPEAKRVAIAEMHQYADKKLETENALHQLFLANGGSILDIYTKGKTKTAT